MKESNQISSGTSASLISFIAWIRKMRGETISNSQAARLIKQGAISIDGDRITDVNARLYWKQTPGEIPNEFFWINFPDGARMYFRPHIRWGKGVTQAYNLQ